MTTGHGLANMAGRVSVADKLSAVENRVNTNLDLWVKTMAKYKLGEICEIVSGSTPKTGIAEYWDGNLKWITPAEIDDESYIITDSARKLTELGVKKTGLSSFPSGTVILS